VSVYAELDSKNQYTLIIVIKLQSLHAQSCADYTLSAGQQAILQFTGLPWNCENVNFTVNQRN